MSIKTLTPETEKLILTYIVYKVQKHILDGCMGGTYTAEKFRELPGYDRIRLYDNIRNLLRYDPDKFVTAFYKDNADSHDRGYIQRFRCLLELFDSLTYHSFSLNKLYWQESDFKDLLDGYTNTYDPEDAYKLTYRADTVSYREMMELKLKSVI